MNDAIISFNIGEHPEQKQEKIAKAKELKATRQQIIAAKKEWDRILILYQNIPKNVRMSNSQLAKAKVLQDLIAINPNTQIISKEKNLIKRLEMYQHNKEKFMKNHIQQLERSNNFKKELKELLKNNPYN